MICPDLRRKYILYGRQGGGSLKNLHYKIEKKNRVWQALFVAVGVRNAYLYPI